MSGDATGIQNGIYSINDVRGLENMDLLSEEEGGNLQILNGNVVKLADAGSAYMRNTESGKENSDESEQEVLEMGKKRNSHSGKAGRNK